MKKKYMNLNFSKLLSTLLALVLLLPLIPAPASAANFPAKNEAFISVAEDGYQNLIFPMEYMKVTQSAHTGQAVDLGGKDSGIDPVFAPCDLVVKQISMGSHTIFFQSLDKVHLANGKLTTITVLMTHKDDVSSYYVGQIFRQGDLLYSEGNYGYSTGNHVHLEVGTGKFKGTGWTKLSSGWSINGRIPADAFFVSPKATTILKPGNYHWVELVDFHSQPAMMLAKVTGTNSSGTAPLRSYPEASGRVTGRLEKGDVVYITQQATNKAGNTWYKVSDLGWVYGKYLTPQAADTLHILAASANLKQGGNYRLTNKGSSLNLQYAGKAIQMSSAAKNTVFTMGAEEGWRVLTPKGKSSLALNVYSDAPVHKSDVNLYAKLTTSTQGFVFQSCGSHYLVRLAYDPTLVLTQVGSRVEVRNYVPGSASQLWKLTKM